MKTVLIFGALLILSLQSQALPLVRLAGDTSSISEQETAVEGSNLSIQAEDIFVFSEGFKFQSYASNSTKFLGPNAGGCNFAMTNSPKGVSEVQLTKALRWKVESVQKLELDIPKFILTTPEVPGRTIEIVCPTSKGLNDLADLARAGAKVVRPLRVEKVNFEEQRHVRIRLDDQMPIDSYDRRGTVFDGQTGDRTPRPRPGQR